MKKIAAAAAVVAGLATLAVTSPASAATVVVEQIYSRTVPESGGQFSCPEGMVMTGRAHTGDENNPTTYWCSRVLIDGVQVQVHWGDWSTGVNENRSTFIAPLDQVLVGRWHQGDERGLTRYRTAALYWQGRQVRITSLRWSGGVKESSHNVQARSGEVMTGRSHSGDENGTTNYQFGLVTFTG
ncbi:hypothetical protein GCM10022252_45450 [Streptosporangium oxazolinicum]|uniref:Secreted protein n=1 Tax=Streptosporangium oxazolinicum TaxID=909287 RepID=A0ABP8B3E6_9ACTN